MCLKSMKLKTRPEVIEWTPYPRLRIRKHKTDGTVIETYYQTNEEQCTQLVDHKVMNHNLLRFGSQILQGV